MITFAPKSVAFLNRVIISYVNTHWPAKALVILHERFVCLLFCFVFLFSLCFPQWFEVGVAYLEKVMSHNSVHPFLLYIVLSQQRLRDTDGALVLSLIS